MGLLATAGHRSRHVHRTAGEDARSLLFAKAQQQGIAIAPVSVVEALDEIMSLVIARPLEPVVRMPDTALA
jgi:hypothetical protein